MIILASGITSLTDARYFAAREVDFLGFNLEEGSDKYLDPMYMKAIREWVQGPKIVGQFSKADASFIREAVAFFGLDGAVISAQQHLNNLPALDGLNLLLYMDLPFDSDAWRAAFEKAAAFVSFFVVPIGQHTGNGHTSFLTSLCSRYPVLIHPDIAVQEIPAMLESLQPAGLGIEGGPEEKVGIKSFDDLETLFDAIGLS
jgi:phosphoribosylanthranilate isomerase